MSREVHNGPTDETQARGTPYSGDPRAAMARRCRSSTSFRSTPGTARAAGAWCRSPATKCRSSTKASSPSICGRARMPACSTSATWASCWSTAASVDAALETLMPGDFQAAADMKPKYSLLLEEDGGIIDDLMATRRGEDFYVVVNGATKHGDIDFMERRLPATSSSTI